MLYHLVFPAKYRCVVFDDLIDHEIKDICLEIEKRYQVKFLEIGTDADHIHFLVQSVPTYNVTFPKKFYPPCSRVFKRFQPKIRSCMGLSSVKRLMTEPMFCMAPDSLTMWYRTSAIQTI